MSDLTERVRDVVASIPTGRVMTYGEVADVVGTGARAVGQVLRRAGHDIPWWRVVDATGKPARGALREAASRFAAEATPLVGGPDDVRVDLAEASWRPVSLPPPRQRSDGAP